MIVFILKVSCWKSNCAVTLFSDVKKTSLPPPWKHGYDGLHLIYEGSSRDMLKELLGKGGKLMHDINQSERKRWEVRVDNRLFYNLQCCVFRMF